MNNQSEKYIGSYFKIRKTIDSVSKKLALNHASHLQCKKGCDMCCMDYSILPVEFFSILHELKQKHFLIAEKEAGDEKQDGNCIFLKNNACTIYESRPVICRTHGLPLLYTNDDYEWELSTCELNFKNFDFEKFKPENTYAQDKFNSRLFMLNREFISNFNGKNGYGEFELIPLKTLAKKL
jgi:uncharacterized protein